MNEKISIVKKSPTDRYLDSLEIEKSLKVMLGEGLGIHKNRKGDSYG